MVEVIINDCLGVDSEGMVDRGKKFSGMDRFVDGRGTSLVGFTVYVTAFDSGSGDNSRVTVRPVITSIRAVTITGRADTHLRPTSELTNADDESLVKDTAFIKIRDES